MTYRWSRPFPKSLQNTRTLDNLFELRMEGTSEYCEGAVHERKMGDAK
jgi:hypothetical protein